jgi:MYXO-CTERM domain-containing protein
VCRAEREITGDGRVIYAEPQRRVVQIGVCDASGACAEGEVAERRQCEPNGETEAFNPSDHRWTGAPYRGGCGGCASAGARRDVPLGLLAAVALFAWTRRRA